MNHLSIAFYRSRRNAKDAVPESILTGTHKGVRNDPTHAVTKHDNSFRGWIVIFWINRMERFVQAGTKLLGVDQNRGPACVVELPDLIFDPDFRILAKRIDQRRERHRS